MFWLRNKKIKFLLLYTLLTSPGILQVNLIKKERKSVVHVHRESYIRVPFDMKIINS